MYRKIVIIGATAAAVLGAGATALAATGSAAHPAAHTSAAAHHPHSQARLLRHVVHAEVVTRRNGTFVTHEFIRGTVTAVSTSSITVKAADEVTETYVVTSATKVRVRHHGSGSPSSIGAVNNGDRVLVAGVKTSTDLTAKRVVDLKGKRN